MLSFSFSLYSHMPACTHTNIPNCLINYLYKNGGGLVAKLYLALIIPWILAYQTPLSMGFSRQEYWSGLPLPSPEDLPIPRIEHRSPALQADSLPAELWGKLCSVITVITGYLYLLVLYMSIAYSYANGTYKRYLLNYEYNYTQFL